MEVRLREDSVFQGIVKGIEETISSPIEDIGVIIIDHHGVTISQYLIAKLIENNVAIVMCNDKHMPTSMLLNLDGNSVQSERFKEQITAKRPLIKNLWQQTVSAKIYNQAMLLEKNNLNSANTAYNPRRQEKTKTRNSFKLPCENTK